MAKWSEKGTWTFLGPGMMSSMMSSGRQDPPGQPAFSSDYLSGECLSLQEFILFSFYIFLKHFYKLYLHHRSWHGDYL